ncbi:MULTISPECIES: tetratricopeptide repeat protein [unclassified Streptomyces]|uniref:tetratricopeptide repeat protein n=1 Tax=unclassified Streptomyces TaxID=2593676 RepID=UPI0022599955|nr:MULTISPECIES: tetratricopeptide repeat protein [unclassified Streptomyces]MCX5048501.1 tetratricopeptide repeat protein [Streptomyces sp. NBC_00474]MCX5056754.1 tetratricopeptide repeat protein [Streptomyces sp. NBC_00452]MCX5287856.1 tetratricopeptide repeat protein [Streptomyces sp. NBC_00183]
MEKQAEAGGRARGGTGAGLGGRRALVAAVAGCAVLGGAVALWPWERAAPRPVAPAAAPGAQALTAVTSGVPAALPDLAMLIDEREARLRTHPRDALTWAVLGTAYVEQGRRTADATNYPRADKALRTSMTVRPKGNTAALDGMAALANARRDFRAARTWGEAALKLEPKRWTTYPPLIDAYTGLGDYKATKRTLDRLLKLRSGAAVRARAAGVYRDRGRREDAAAALTDAAAGAGLPAEQAAYLERAGQLAWERGDLEEALRRFQAAVRLDPDQRAAQAGQGRTLAALGRTTEALNSYRVALDKQPCPQYALELGELYESLGLGQAARVEYDLLRTRVTDETAGGVDDDLVLGVFEADHGDPQAAVRRLRVEWQRQPGIPVADALGWALHRAGDDKEALKFAAAATDQAHGGGVRSALYAYHRGMIEQESGLAGPARRHLQEAMRINPYFSPLAVPLAKQALAALGEPPDEPVPTVAPVSTDDEDNKAGQKTRRVTPPRFRSARYG